MLKCNVSSDKVQFFVERLIFSSRNCFKERMEGSQRKKPRLSVDSRANIYKLFIGDLLKLPYVRRGLPGSEEDCFFEFGAPSVELLFVRYKESFAMRSQFRSISGIVVRQDVLDTGDVHVTLGGRCLRILTLIL